MTVLQSMYWLLAQGVELHLLTNGLNRLLLSHEVQLIADWEQVLQFVLQSRQFGLQMVPVQVTPLMYWFDGQAR